MHILGILHKTTNLGSRNRHLKWKQYGYIRFSEDILRDYKLDNMQLFLARTQQRPKGSEPSWYIMRI